MSRIIELHDQAMELSDEAFIAKRRGNSGLANQLLEQAFELEVASAELVRDKLDIEPTRSVLYRSAASLALDVGKLQEAERLIAIALSGYPPPDVADELRDLLEQVQFDRHLDVRGITLEAGEFQFSIAGKAVAHGMTLSTIFVERIVNIEKIIFRTVERTLGKEFREQGQPSHSLQEGYSLYMATPRPGSFSVTLRLGRQMQLPELDLSPQIVTDVIECFNLLNNDDEQLRERIPQEVYYRNFVQLAKNIAPDGEQVSLVGLTAGKGTDEIRARFTRTKKEIQVPPPPPILNEPDSKNGKFVEVQGRLLFADAEKDERVIRLRSKTGKSYQIIVPPGMMNDIVRPLWDDIVVVRGQQYGKKIYLSDIDRTSDEA